MLRKSKTLKVVVFAVAVLTLFTVIAFAASSRAELNGGMYYSSTADVNSPSGYGGVSGHVTSSASSPVRFYLFYRPYAGASSEYTNWVRYYNNNYFDSGYLYTGYFYHYGYVQPISSDGLGGYAEIFCSGK